MNQRGKRRYAALGIALCAAALAASVALQRAGYLTYLNSDMASELILARRQADTGSLIQMDWLYSTEIHTVHMNLLYALALRFTPDFSLARIIGNTLGFVLGMGACAALCRMLDVSLCAGLCTAAMLPFAASALYAANMTIGGYYIIHLPFAFLTAALWLRAAECGRLRGRALAVLLAYLALCGLQGLLSVRYVLCFICPMVVVAGLDVLLAPQVSRSLRDGHLRFGGVTAAGFAACLAGYLASEILYPRLFVSGTGAASSFLFNPLDGQEMLDTLATVCADFLRLLGWRGGVPLFSAAGLADLCITGVLVLGAIMTCRVYRGLSMQERMQRRQKRMMQYALAAFAVNLFCFVFIKGTYLNRYLILAVIFLVPVLPVAVSREKSLRLRAAFLALLCAQLGLAGMTLYGEVRVQEEQAAENGADMMDAAAFLLDAGYTHGYGTFWNVRVMQERTQGALTFTGVVPAETEDGAVCAVVPDMIRWLEPDGASHLDACPGKTFLLLTREEAKQLAPWLETTGAPLLYENGRYRIYGFENSQQLVSAMLFGRMKLTDAQAEDGIYTMQAGGRMRVPTGYREAGAYVLRFDCAGEPAQDSRVQVYRTSSFEMFAEQAIQPGENVFSFDLEHSDKYFMILFTSGKAQALQLGGLSLDKAQEAE